MSNNMVISCEPERFVRIASYSVVGKLRDEAASERNQFKAKAAELMYQVVTAIERGDDVAVEAMLGCKENG